MTAPEIHALARRLLDDGLINNEPDALLAALHLLAAADPRSPANEPNLDATSTATEHQSRPAAD